MFRNGFLIISIVLIVSCSPSLVLGDRQRQGEGRGKGLEYEVLRCIDECDNTDIREYLLCQRDCAFGSRGRGREEEPEQRHGGRGIDPRWQPRPGRERIPELTRESEYDRCIQRCEAEGPGGRGRVERWQLCEDQCEELLRGRERRGGRERERERIPELTRESEYDRCLRRCEAEGPGDRGREARWRQCEEQCGELRRTRERRRGQEREPERTPESTPRSEYERCLRRCKSEGPGSRGREGQWRQCEDQCEELWMAQERRRDWEREREIFISNDRTGMMELKGRLGQCMRRCERWPGGQQRQLCKFRCQQQQRRQGEESEEEMNHHLGGEEEEIEGGDGDTNPYYFHSGKFRGQFETEHGHVRVLEKFTKRSKLLKGIENYRFAVLEANPNTFVVPHHADADYVLFVLNGRGNISLVLQEKSESYELEQGDVIRVSSGTTMHLMNAGNERIQIAKLVLPVNMPGSFQVYFPVGSEDPESYYWAFSDEILEAAFRTPIDQLERLFGQQRQGAIVRLRDGQLRDLSQIDVSLKKTKGHHRGASKSRGTFNLLSERPIYSNRFGRFFQASPEETKQLRDIGISVTFVEVNQGAMLLPHYNSRTTFLVFVQEGSGFIEMACPHLASKGQGRRRREEEHREIRGRYKRVVSRVSPGDFFVIPAGHPITIVASQNENLRMAGFGINALKNQRNFLAGRVNIMNQMDREAKQLAFNVPAQEIDRIFSNQEECCFAPANTGK